MALLSRQQIVNALERLGQLAAADGCTLRLTVVGGAAIVLGFNTRESTHDIDALFLPPPEPKKIREWAAVVAGELDWPDDWLNDAAKGYVVGLTSGPVLLSAPGIEVCRAKTQQLLAMKLCAWRDDVDIGDAGHLLSELARVQKREEIWQSVIPHLIPGHELKAQYAFDDLWESLYGHP